MAAALQTVALTKRFGGLVATNDLSLSVEVGEIRGVIGPNGAGKTTFINLVSGVEAPSSGSIRLHGHDVSASPAFQRARLGVLRTFQVPKLFMSMTILDNLLVPYLALGKRDFKHARERAGELLEMTKLVKLAASPAKHLSGGQQALLQLATGFMVDELRCYLLDEPFAGVNPVIRETMVELIVRHNRSQGVTFVVVSHEMSVIRQLCPRVSVLAEGRLLLEGTLDEVSADQGVIDAYLGKTWK